GSAMDERTFARARRAYEVGRLYAALPWGALCVAYAAAPRLLESLVCACMTSPAFTCAVGGALAALVTFLVWRGGARGAAAKAGVVGGLAAWIAPIACPSRALCVAVGVAAGAIVGVLARRRAARTPGETGWTPTAEYVALAAAIAAAAGVLGC